MDHGMLETQSLLTLNYFEENYVFTQKGSRPHWILDKYVEG